MDHLTDSQTSPMTKEQWLSHNALQYDTAAAMGFTFDHAGGIYVLARWVQTGDNTAEVEVAHDDDDRASWFPQPITKPGNDGLDEVVDPPTDDRTKTYWLVKRETLDPAINGD